MKQKKNVLLPVCFSPSHHMLWLETWTLSSLLWPTINTLGSPSQVDWVRWIECCCLVRCRLGNELSRPKACCRNRKREASCCTLHPAWLQKHSQLDLSRSCLKMFRLRGRKKTAWGHGLDELNWGMLLPLRLGISPYLEQLTSLNETLHECYYM